MDRPDANLVAYSHRNICVSMTKCANICRTGQGPLVNRNTSRYLYISLCVAVSWLCSAVVCGAEDSDPELLANIARLSRIEFANPDIDSKYAIFGEAASVLAL